MKRIAYLCSEYPAISHTFIFREIESLRQQGFQVLPVSIRRTANLHQMTAAEQDEAAHTYTLKEVPFRTGLKALWRTIVRHPRGLMHMLKLSATFCLTGPKNPYKAFGYLAEAILLGDWLERQQITHLHEHFANPTALVALLIKQGYGIGYSLSVHGPDIFYQVDSSLLQKKTSAAEFVRCISHFSRSQLWRISPLQDWDKFHIVGCGVDPESYHPRDRKSTTGNQLLCVGRLCPAKGQHILLEACRQLKEQQIDFQLTFVGDGEDRLSLEQLTCDYGLQEQVTFTGVLGQTEVRDHYNQADIFVLPSFAEGVPVVLMEAMAKEIPVVTTRITGIPELVEDGHNGLLATPGDCADLTRQLTRLLRDKKLAEELGKRGRVTVSDRYNQRTNNLILGQIMTRMEPLC